MSDLEKQLRNLEVENERLRGALKRIITAQECLGEDGYRPFEYRSQLDTAIDEARRVLAGEKKQTA